MLDIQLIILFIISLPWCLTVNLTPRNSPDVESSKKLDWDAKFIELHGGVYSLHDIYGDVIPGLENVIEPGQAILNSDFKTKIIAAPALSDASALESIKYTDRELILLNPMIMPSDSSESMIKTADIDIAAAIVDDLINLQKNSQVFLLGEMQSGKTVELLKIERTLHRRLKGFWIVRLSVDENFPLDQDIHGIVKYIADTHITENCRQLFLNVFEINPKKLIFLIDDIDAITAKTRSIVNLPNFVIELKNYGVTTVMTGSKRIQGLLMHSIFEILTGNVYEIPEMSVTEVEQYLKNIWNIPHQQLHGYQNSLEEYVTVFTEILFQTSIPRNPGILKTLADQFKHRSHPSPSGENLFNVGCNDYIFKPETLPGNIYSSLKHTPVNIYKFYSEYLDSLSWYKLDKTFYDLEHGKRAFLQIGYEMEVWKKLKEIPLTNEHFPTAVDNLNRRAPPLLDNYGKFYHPSYKYYFAAKYLQSESAIDMCTHEQWQEIFTNSRSLRLLEMLNFAHEATVKTDALISTIIRNDVEILHPILDNIVKNGFENLFIEIHKILSESGNLKLLQHYFSHHYLMLYPTPNRYFSMIQSENAHIEFPIKTENKIVLHPKSRLEYLVENDMSEALTILLEDKIEFRVEENYQVILHKAVTKSLPNLQLVQQLINKVRPAIKEINYSDLLYRTVSEVGSPCEPIAKYLQHLGANPNYIAPNGQTLLHAAVQWGSRRLVQFLLEELSMEITDTVDSAGKSVFRTALEVNPSPLYTLNNYWDMILYLSKKMNYGFHLSITAKFDRNLFISPSDAQSSWIKVIFSTADSIDMNKLNFDAAELKINPLGYHDPMYQRFAAIARAVPSTMWDVSPETRGLRVNHLLTDIYGTFLALFTFELLVRLRGRSELSISDHEAYRETIAVHWVREKNVLHFRDRTRIFRILTNNIKQKEDITVLSNLVERGLLTNLHYSVRFSLAADLAQCLAYTKKNTFLSAGKLPWKDQLVKENVNEQPSVALTSEFEGTLKPLVQMVRNSDVIESSSDYNSRNVIQCLNKRKKRYTHSINCFFGWSDVDRFNDAPRNLRTSSSDIIVNSDHFINTIAEIELTEPNRARQLTSLVDGLITERGFSSVLSGNRQSLVRDVIDHGSMESLRLYEQATDTVHDLWDPSAARSPSEPQNPIALQSHGLGVYIAMSIPAMMSLYHVVNECSKKTSNDTSCTTASLELGKAVVLGPGGMFVVEYTPWIIDTVTRFPTELLASRTPQFIIDKMPAFRYVGLKYAAVYMGRALIVLGIINDLYNIGYYSVKVDKCKFANECHPQIRRDYAIALGFSCFGAVMNAGLLLAGVGLIPALAAGFVLMGVQMATMALLKVIEYQKKYQTTISEDFKNFFSEFFGISPSSQWQAVVNRTDWVNQVGNHARNYLEKASDNVVAYAVGLGDVQGSEILPGRSFINMKNFNVNNSMDLSTILPEEPRQTILLCLPKRDPDKLYDKEPRKLDKEHKRIGINAGYACSNSFVMGNYIRWLHFKNERSKIIYNLGHVNDGIIVGSDEVTNEFYISDSKETLKIVGGTGNINNYLIKSLFFRGNIILNPANDNFLHLNDINSRVLAFSWSTKFNNGRIQCDSNVFYLQSLQQPAANLSLYGREGKQDRFFCDYSHHEHSENDDAFIKIYGFGGESENNMDHVEDCQYSVLHPFTRILGSATRQLKYTTSVWLDFKAYTNDNVVHAVIEPRLSIFDVIFTTYPLFPSLRDVKYHPKNRTLTWHLHHTGSVLLLSIVPFYAPAENQSLSSVTAIFYDNFTNSQIFPVIEEPDNDRVLSVREFNVFTSSPSAELKDVIKKYKIISTQISSDFHVAIKIMHNPTQQSFIFGSDLSEKFYIDEKTKFVCGRGGADMYFWTVQSQEMAIIDNVARDNLQDMLLVPMGKCSSLEPMRNDSDVTLICANTNNPHLQYLTLRNYIVSPHDSRHLEIYWNNVLYMILPDEWVPDESELQEEIPLAIIFSFGAGWQQTMMMTSNYKYIVLKRTLVSELAAYRYNATERDLVLTEKFFSGSSRSVMRFQNFFDDEQKVDSQWFDLNIYIYDGEIEENVVPIVWSARNLFRLFLDGIIDFMSNGNDEDNSMEEVMQEYIVNVTGEPQEVFIDHNPDPHRQMKLGLLTVFNAEPKDFQAAWSSSNRSVLTLCARKTCVHVQNWCRSILHRLNRIVFTPENALIKNLDHLDCQESINMLEESSVIRILHEKFKKTEEERVLLRSIPDTDRIRLIRCIGIVYFAAIAEEYYVHRIFGFKSINEAGQFLERNSNVLSTKNLAKLSVHKVKSVLKIYIKIFMIRGDITKDDRLTIEVLEKYISWLNKGKCWTEFIDKLVNRRKLGKKNTSSILIKKTQNLVKCQTRLKKKQERNRKIFKKHT